MPASLAPRLAHSAGFVVILAVYFFLPSLREFPEIPPLWKFLGFVQNIDLRGGTAFSHAWSLCVEGQFYLFLPFLLVMIVPRRHAGLILACGVVGAGLVLRAALAYSHPGETGVSFRAFQKLIYYPTWTRLDPLVFGVGLAAIEQFRQPWWLWLQDAARWLWAPGLAAIVYGLSLAETDLTIAACVWQFPLIALGMATLLVCAVSPRLPLRRLPLPGAAFVASIAYSVYLSHKLVIHAVKQLCAGRNIPLTSAIGIGLNLSTAKKRRAPPRKIKRRDLFSNCGDAVCPLRILVQYQKKSDCRDRARTCGQSLAAGVCLSSTDTVH